MSFPPKSTAARILWVVCIALLFIVVFAPLASSPENPLAVRVNSSVDRKITTTLELAGASSAAALAVSAIPDDTATPIAEKLADFGSGFLLVLCVLSCRRYWSCICCQRYGGAGRCGSSPGVSWPPGS